MKIKITQNTFKNNLQILFKKFTYSLFKLFHGNIKGIIKLDKNKNEQYTTILGNNYKYNIYICKNSRVYTDTIHDTAFIKDNYLIDGPSFQFRNNVIVDCEKNIVFEKGTPRVKKKIEGRVFSLLTGGGGNSNYFHWLFDVLPRLIILRQKIDWQDINFFLFPDINLNFQKETLDFLKIPHNKRLSSKLYRHIYAQEIISVDHPCVILNDPLKDNNNIPKWILEFYKNEIKTKMNLKKNIRKIYIDRSDSTSNIKDLRFIINENQVKELLINKGFKAVRLSSLSFVKQVELFNSADTIVGLHGAGLSNILFCEPDTKIIEIKPAHVGNMYERLGNNLSLNYINLKSDSQNININQPNQLGDIKVDLNKLEKLIN